MLWLIKFTLVTESYTTQTPQDHILRLLLEPQSGKYRVVKISPDMSLPKRRVYCMDVTTYLSNRAFGWRSRSWKKRLIISLGDYKFTNCLMLFNRAGYGQGTDLEILSLFPRQAFTCS